MVNIHDKGNVQPFECPSTTVVDAKLFLLWDVVLRVMDGEAFIRLEA